MQLEENGQTPIAMAGGAAVLAEVSRLFRFGLVGIVATGVYVIATLIAVELLALSAIPASIFGQVASTGVSYFGHALFSFRVKIDHRSYLWRFLLIAAATFGMNFMVTWLLTSVAGASYRISVTVVTVLLPVTNYLCNRCWVFLPARAQSQRPMPPATLPREDDDL